MVITDFVYTVIRGSLIVLYYFITKYKILLLLYASSPNTEKYGYLEIQL